MHQIKVGLQILRVSSIHIDVTNMAGGRTLSCSVTFVILVLSQCFKTMYAGTQVKVSGPRPFPYNPHAAALQNSTKFYKVPPSLGGHRSGIVSHGKRYFSSRVKYYPNDVASFQLARLITSGDICPNPGPTRSTRTSKVGDAKSKRGSVNPVSTQTSEFKCALLNARSLKAFYRDTATGDKTCKLVALKRLIHDNSYDIIAVTETWLSTTIMDSEISGKNYSIYKRNRVGRRGGGVLLLIKSNIASSRRYDLEVDLEMVCVELKPALKECAKELSTSLCSLFNKFLSTSSLPLKWKTSLIVPVVCHPIAYHMYFNLIYFTVRDESVINK